MENRTSFVLRAPKFMKGKTRRGELSIEPNRAACGSGIKGGQRRKGSWRKEGKNSGGSSQRRVKRGDIRGLAVVQPSKTESERKEDP